MNKVRTAAGVLVLSVSMIAGIADVQKDIVYAVGAAPYTVTDVAYAPAQPMVSFSLDSAVKISDISAHWAEAKIKDAISAGYVHGYQDGSFRPDNNITRAEFITLAVGAMDGTQSNGTDHWYDNYVAKAIADGLVKDTDGLGSDWNKPMTRLELAKVAVRAIGKDTADASQWMVLATESGLIHGMNDAGTLAPNAPTTRAQSITIIQSILSAKAGKTLDIQQTAVDQAKKDAKTAVDYSSSEAQLASINTNIFAMAPEIFGGKTYDGSGNTAKQTWGSGQFSVESDKYKGHLDKAILVDLTNPDDPNYGIMDWTTLQWGGSVYMTGHENAYALVFKTIVEKNDTGIKYKFVPVNVDGPNQSADDINKGIPSTVYNISSQATNLNVNAFIIPKGKVNINGSLQFSLVVPVYPGTTPKRTIMTDVMLP